MKMVRYVCTHCGRKFEAEEKEILECPGCFWSTSVKREDEAAAASKPVSVKTEKFPSKPFSFAPLVRPLLILIAGLAAAALLFLFGLPALQKAANQKPRAGISLPGFGKKDAAKPQKPKPGTVPVVVPSEPTAEEVNVLERRIQLSAERVLLPEEEQVLKNKAAFRTGISEKLPSQPWNLENFKQMIAEQERFYKVPLPGSYKKKLLKLFTEKYLAATEPFNNGDLLQARNLWVESLAFPIYANDPKKHKGVALTMLRPFIADTLSKIGAINGTLIERTVREKEQAVTTSYTQLLGLLDQKNWAEARTVITKLQQDLAQFSDPSRLIGAVPAYPAGIAQVDPDIQYTLSELLKTSPPATADLGQMQRDVDAKRKVVESFSAENIQTAQTAYDEALDLIRQKKWKEAAERLKKIQLPLPLAQDAQEKLKIISRLAESQLDSQPKQG